MLTRTLTLAMGLAMAAPAWALEGPAPAAGTGAASAVATPNPTPAAFQPGTGKSVHLGKIEVPGVKPLVETLQEIKVAIKRPFDNDPAHFDDMVCRLGDGDIGSHSGMTLECGTEGWFNMRRSSVQMAMLSGGGAATPTLGHPWHVVRALTPHQIMMLRKLLKELPPPGQGEVQVMDDGKAPLEETKR